MPFSSDDQPGAPEARGYTVLVLRQDTEGLGIGFGRPVGNDPPGSETRIPGARTLRLTVEFPQTGTSGCYRTSPAGEVVAGDLRAFSLEVLAPYQFGTFFYDPLSSMADSLARLAGGRPGSLAAVSGGPGPGPGQAELGLMALWAVAEADLYRFARDPGCTSAVDAAAVAQPADYRRFADLNTLYRDLVKLLVPWGRAPGRWTAWLQERAYRPLLPLGLSRRLEALTSGLAGMPGGGFSALSSLFARYGTQVGLEQD